MGSLAPPLEGSGPVRQLAEHPERMPAHMKAPVRANLRNFPSHYASSLSDRQCVQHTLSISRSRSEFITSSSLRTPSEHVIGKLRYSTHIVSITFLCRPNWMGNVGQRIQVGETGSSQVGAGLRNRWGRVWMPEYLSLRLAPATGVVIVRVCTPKPDRTMFLSML